MMRRTVDGFLGWLAMMAAVVTTGGCVGDRAFSLPGIGTYPASIASATSNQNATGPSGLAFVSNSADGAKAAESLPSSPDKPNAETQSFKPPIAEAPIAPVASVAPIVYRPSEKQTVAPESTVAVASSPVTAGPSTVPAGAGTLVGFGLRNTSAAPGCAACGNAACGPNGLCGRGGCASCQACPSTPMSYMPYPPGYFNPNLIDPNEYICDGGDEAPFARAKVGDLPTAEDRIIGVEPQDTVVRYTTDNGSVEVQASNRVCLYAPRFAAVRKVTGAESGELAVGPIGVAKPEGPIRAELVQPGLALTGRDELRRGSAVRGPDAMRERNRGVPVERVEQIEIAEDVLAVLQNLALVNRGILRDSEKPWLSMAAQSAIVWSIEEQVAVTVNQINAVTLTRDQRVEEMVVYDFPDQGRLRICKLADKSNALPGEEVTFILRVDNVGDSPVRDIVITDSLVTRLEYITDTQKCTVPAEFSVADNQDESLRLSWSLKSELKVGEGATIEFKCKVR